MHLAGASASDQGHESGHLRLQDEGAGHEHHLLPGQGSSHRRVAQAMAEPMRLPGGAYEGAVGVGALMREGSMNPSEALPSSLAPPILEGEDEPGDELPDECQPALRSMPP